jgi:hypothetical protein
LIATVRSRRVSRARYTSPMPPAPSGETISYGPSLVPEARGIGGENYNLREQRTAPYTPTDRTRHFRSSHQAVTPGWSLALIGNASGQTVGGEGISNRGVFDKETRRKPLAFAADAVRYGISTAVGCRIEWRGNTGEL